MGKVIYINKAKSDKKLVENSAVTAIEIRKLNFSYDVEILKDLNITIEKGRFYTILGPNGSGKTTLLKLISRVLNTEKGKIYIENKDISSFSLRALAKEISVVPQNTVIEFDFTVQDIVLMGRTPHISRFSSESEEDLAITKKAMETTNTWHLKDKNISNLSGGEKQRVIAARAIAQETGCILLDEPISHLDIHHQIEILNGIKKLNEEKNKTVVAVLHDLNMAAAYSDCLVLMQQGRVHSIGTPEEILNKKAIEEVYQVEVEVIKNPVTGKPHVITII